MVTKDFTRKRKKLEFTIDDDVFEAKHPIPAQVLLDFAKKFGSMSESSPMDEQLEAFKDVLALVLKPDSLKIFTARMADVDNPIEVAQIEEIIEWLFEEYGMRPTELSDPSLPGSDSQDAGTSSTDSTSVPV